MTSAQLEARVLELVDVVRGGGRIEDDLVECKSEWPGTGRARQLAGSANSAHGDPLLWIIGLDEDSGQVVRLQEQDPALWWSKMQARFDQDVAPALTSHLRVPTGQNEGVIALLFSTDRVPYLVKTASGGSPEREIPIRDGTRTRSAHRDELIRILIPALMVPNVIILGANIVATWYLKPPSAPGQPADIKDRIDINGRVSFYVEHTSSDVIVIPGHEMAASLIFKEHEIPLNIFGGGAPKSPNPRWGVYLEKEDLICTAPGRTMLNIQGSPALEHYDLFLSATEATLSLTLGVAGGSRPIRATGKMPRQEVSPYAKNARIKTIGRWGIGNL